MKYEVRKMGPLADVFPAGGLFGSWLGSARVAAITPASEELAAFDRGEVNATKAPLWEDASFRERLPKELQDPQHRPDVVVTGQQPGFLGGPLLTLYKIATAIALAERRTAAGRPTIPVFWSGDADDDLAEALAPVGWAGGDEGLWRSPALPLAGGHASRRVLAGIEPGIWASPVLDKWPPDREDDELCSALRSLLGHAAESGTRWGIGQAGLLARIFADRNLIVVRGNDPDLHRAAAPLYERLTGRLTHLADLVRARGEALTDAGYHAQIAERSLARPLFRLEGDRRAAVGTFGASDAATLRPGVMLRSVVQDWLLQPVAVVVGPGELAYLKQIDPLYEALSVPRSPLVPRLSGWILPDGAAYERAAGLAGRAAPQNGPDVDAMADRIGETVRDEVIRVLTGELAVDPMRAAELGAGRARRFRKGVVTMLKGEIRRRQEAEAATSPVWVMPGGQRQERSLGLLSALAHWQEPLVAAIMGAARSHLAAGATGDWREWGLLVPDERKTP